jgi:hypothetical protein
MDDRELQQQMLVSQNFIATRAIHPETKLIYGRIDLEDPEWWKNTVFPSPESIRNRFCNDSETPNVSNCAIAAGEFIAAVVDCYDVTGLSECVDQAETVFQGMKNLANASKIKGFIARCILPCDGVTHLLNSSVDQYTYYVYGLWKYYHSSLSNGKQKEEIKEIINAICQCIEEYGFSIPATNGIPAPVSDIGVIRSDRSSRLLEVYLVGYDIIGNKHWLETYNEKLKENGYARLHSILDPDKIECPYPPRDKINNSTQATWAILQTQYSLVPLFEMEKDITIRAAYLEAMRINAKIVEGRSNIGAGGIHVILLAQNRSLVTPVISPWSEKYVELLKTQCLQILDNSSKSSIATVAAYWTAVKLGLLKYHSDNMER